MKEDLIGSVASAVAVRTAQRGERHDDEACMRLRVVFSSSTPHWGGAGDGTPHLPLTWEALLLIDSALPGPIGAPVDSRSLAILCAGSLKPFADRPVGSLATNQPVAVLGGRMANSPARWRLACST